MSEEQKKKSTTQAAKAKKPRGRPKREKESTNFSISCSKEFHTQLVNQQQRDGFNNLSAFIVAVMEDYFENKDGTNKREAITPNNRELSVDEVLFPISAYVKMENISYSQLYARRDNREISIVSIKNSNGTVSEFVSLVSTHKDFYKAKIEMMDVKQSHHQKQIDENAGKIKALEATKIRALEKRIEELAAALGKEEE